MKDVEVYMGPEACDELYDKYVKEEKISFIPRIGEFIWPTALWLDRMTKTVKECWRKNRCPDCPFMWGATMDEDHIALDDLICVHTIINDIENNRVIIRLADEFYDMPHYAREPQV